LTQGPVVGGKGAQRVDPGFNDPFSSDSIGSLAVVVNQAAGSVLFREAETDYGIGQSLRIGRLRNGIE
jgi:hypothetical protein